MTICKIEVLNFFWQNSYFLRSISIGCNRVELTLRRSILNAHSYAKQFVKKIDQSNDFFTQDVSIILAMVVNEYLIFGSGPSAGCVYASILISLALQRPIYQNLAMTGQISSKGEIGRIGGVEQKVGAVVEAGLKEVIIPKENREDFENLPQKIKENVIVHYAETFQDIFEIAFEQDI